MKHRTLNPRTLTHLRHVARPLIGGAVVGSLLLTAACADNDEVRPNGTLDGGDDAACVDCLDLDDAGGDQPGGTEICATLDGAFSEVTPTVVLLVDQSGSMSEGYGDQSRWDALYDALMDPGQGVISSLEDDVRFGLTLYTSNNGFDGGTCPMLSSVEVGFGNREAMDAVYAAASVADDTPTGESLMAVADQLAALEIDGPKAIILATDGEPDTCDKADPNTGDNLVEARALSVQAAEDAYSQGITTYMLSVGSDIADEHLEAMAAAGAGTMPGDAPFYRPANEAELVQDIQRIVEGERSCVFAVEGDLTDVDLAEAVVTVDGETLEQGVHYKLRDDGYVEILGQACDALMSGDHEVSGTFYCGEVVEGEVPTPK